MNFITEKISPQKAREFLATSRGNRPISTVTVNKYASVMKNGGWLLNGQCIIFDTEGHLMDGHHRLNAVIKASTPVPFGVLRGVPSVSFTTIDCGRQRTAGHVLAMSGVKNYNSVCAISTAVHVLRMTGRLSENNSGFSNGRFSNSDKYDFYMTDPDGFQKAHLFSAMMTRKGKVVSGSWTGAIYYFLLNDGHYDRTEVEPFFDCLFSLESSAIPVAALLRKNILRVTLSGKRMTAEYLWAWLAKAWNYYVDGKAPKRINYYPNTEEIPRLRLKALQNHQEQEADKPSSPLEVWAKKAMGSTDTLTTTQVANSMGMSAKVLNQRLKDAGIQYFQSGQWLLKQPFAGWNLSEARTSTFTRPNGTTGTSIYTVWNERGRFFIDALKRNNFNVEQTMQYIKG